MRFLPIPQGNLSGVFVPNAATAYAGVAIAIIGAVLTYMGRGEADRFEGVPEGDKIKQRQKMIAEIEKKYGEGD